MNLFANAELFQTKGIAAACEESPKFKTQIIVALGRFYGGDWGDVCDEDKDVNNESLETHDRVLAVYETSKGNIWISGESHGGDYYDTIVILFPSEY